jgi:hypothetical protein
MDAGVAAVVVASIAAVAGTLSAFISAKAARIAKPVGNGFAADVLRRLGRIETLILNHLEDHAGNDVRRGE